MAPRWNIGCGHRIVGSSTSRLPGSARFAARAKAITGCTDQPAGVDDDLLGLR